MAKIRFKPICCNCGAVVHGIIDCAELMESIDSYPPKLYKTYAITPEKCPKCGEKFTEITMPTKLPFWSNV